MLCGSPAPAIANHLVEVNNSSKKDLPHRRVCLLVFSLGDFAMSAGSGVVPYSLAGKLIIVARLIQADASSNLLSTIHVNTYLLASTMKKPATSFSCWCKQTSKGKPPFWGPLFYTYT